VTSSWFRWASRPTRWRGRWASRQRASTTGITGDTALRLARYFDTDAQSWLNLQSAYDLRVAEIAAGRTINRHVKPRAA
jgi:plasmid maintenance system antidote protein VapI